MESVIFNINLISFLIPIVFTTIKPFPFQIKTTEDAKRRGWNSFAILVTRVCPYLTLYTQFWTLVAMYNMEPITMFIAQSMTWTVFLLYHGINIIDPVCLTYHPREFVKEVVSWKPPMSKNIVIWFGLHLQHTIFPFYLHYLTYKYDVNYYNSLYPVIANILVMGLYVIWHLFCWQVQGIAAYPFLNEFRDHSCEIGFYCFGFIIIVLINCILASMWRELIFYLIGFMNMYLIRRYA